MVPSRLMARDAPSRSSASDRTCGRGLIELLNECTNNNVGGKPWTVIPARAAHQYSPDPRFRAAVMVPGRRRRDMSTHDTLGVREAEIGSLLGEPGLHPFLPLLYVAWADGDLEPNELRLIRSKVDAAKGLTPSVRAALGRWLDPETPPSAQSIQDLLAVIRRGAE